MKTFITRAIAAAALLVLATGPAFGQTNTPIVRGSDGKPKDSTAVVCASLTGVLTPCASVGTGGGAATTSTTQVGGKDGSGNLQAERVDQFGGAIGGTMIGTASRSTLTASASTALAGGATTTRPSYLKLTIETALAADLFLCLAAQTCSATVYDELIPSGSGKGTRFVSEFPSTAAVTYFTTGTPTVNATRLGN